MKKKTGIIVAGCLGVLILVGVLLAVVLNGKESYRNIRVQETTGTTLVTREGAEKLDAYNGMVLQSGDRVAVSEASDMIMKLDADKYVYAEEKTKFAVEAEGKEQDGKLVIQLEDGAVLIEIAKKLSENESFEVHTTNVSMAVRGTVFYVSCKKDENGTVVTEVSVFDGKVEVFGKGQADPVVLEPGMKATYVEEQPAPAVEEISLEELPEETLRRLIVIETETLYEKEQYEAALSTPTPEPTATSTPTPEPTATNTPTPTVTNTPTPTPEPTVASTPTPVPTPEPTVVSTPTPVPTPEPTVTPTPTPVATSTPTPMATSTPMPVATSTPTPVATSTPTPTPTNTPTPTPTNTPTPTPTNTPTPTPTNTPTPVPTIAISVLSSEKADLKYEMAWNGLILTTKEDPDSESALLYGAVNYKGEEVIPHVYSGYYDMGEEGYVALELDDENLAHVYDKDGKLILEIESPQQIRVTGHILVYTSDYVLFVYDLLERETLYTYATDFSLAVKMSDNLIYVLDFKGGELFCAELNPDTGEVTKKADDFSVSYVLGTLEDRAYVYPNNRGFHDGYTTVYFYKCFGGESNKWRYNRAGLMSEDGEQLLFDIQEFYQHIGAGKNATMDYVAVGASAGNLTNVGRCFTVKVTEGDKSTVYLMNFAKAKYETRATDVLGYDGNVAFVYKEQIVSNLDEVVVASYDSIILNKSGCFVALKDDKAYYIDKDGKVLGEYKDAASFSSGYAAVLAEDGNAYIINEKFQVVSGAYPADSIDTGAGNAVIIQKGEENSIILLPVAVSEYPETEFVAWEDAGLTDHVMDWQDEGLEEAMRDICGIYDRDIMLSDVWEITELDLDYNCTYTEDISALSELKNLRSLRMLYSDVTDYSPLAGLKNLRVLNIAESPIVDLEFIRELPELRELYIGIFDTMRLGDVSFEMWNRAEITDYSPLLDAKNLKKLSMSFVDVQESNFAEVIGKMTSLTELNIAGCNITDLSPLKTLNNLTFLEVSANALTDLSPLSGLKNLEILLLGYFANIDTYYLNGVQPNKIADLSPLTGLKKLKELDLTFCGTEDLSPISGLENLEILRLFGTKIKNYDVLKNLPELRDITVVSSHVEGLLVLSEMPRLDKIKLCDESGYYTLRTGILEENGVLYSGNRNQLLGFTEEYSETAYVMPESLESVIDGAFLSAPSLTSVTISSKVKTTYFGFNSHPNLKEIFVAEDNPYLSAQNGVLMDVEEMEIYDMAGAIEHLIIPEGIWFAYYPEQDLSRITKLTILSDEISPSNLRGLDNLKEIVFGEAVTQFAAEGPLVFDKDKTTLVYVAPGVEEVVVPEGVTELDSIAFAYCKNIKRITLPNSVTTIGEKYGGYMEWGNRNAVIVVPAGSYAEEYVRDFLVKHEVQ